MDSRFQRLVPTVFTPTALNPRAGGSIRFGSAERIVPPERGLVLHFYANGVTSSTARYQHHERLFSQPLSTADAHRFANWIEPRWGTMPFIVRFHRVRSQSLATLCCGMKRRWRKETFQTINTGSDVVRRLFRLPIKRRLKNLFRR